MRFKQSFLLKAGITLVLVVLATGLFGCTTKKEVKKEKPKPPATSMILATTTSTQDTGLLDEIVPKFEEKYNVKVKTIAVGTGEAIAMGEKGDADVLLVHSRKSEDKFMADGNGSVRKDVMYNDFIIIGSEKDPAGIKGQVPSKALAAIAAAGSPFINRGDASGTDKKEKDLWTKAGVTPSGDWYIKTGQGMGESARVANEKQAYILIDRGTYLSLKKTLKLVILVEGQKELFNPYGVIAVNPAKFPKVNNKDAMNFVNWITSAEVQKMIGDFGKKKYGQALFTPSAATGNP
jgi:tungstate transport system substrate-binding protein